MKYFALTLFVLSCFVHIISCKKNNTIKTYYDNEKNKLKEEYEIIKSDTGLMRQGFYKKYYEDSKIIESSNYKNGVLDGKRLLYYTNGKIEIEENYVLGNLEGKYIKYFENGDIEQSGMYINNMMSGNWRTYYKENHKILKEEVEFANNVENGAFKEYFFNGALHYIGKYKDEVEDSIVVEFDSIGNKIAEILYANGRVVHRTEIKKINLTKFDSILTL
jgi:antitoxin component YwqK of YwqJK toxin-antitoxin module